MGCSSIGLCASITLRAGGVDNGTLSLVKDQGAALLWETSPFLYPSVSVGLASSLLTVCP